MSADDPKFVDMPEFAADPTRVFNLLEDLRRAWETILNGYHEQVPFMDGMMALHNFHKLGLDHIVAEAQVTGVQAAVFFEMAAATFEKAMRTRAAQMRGKG